MSDDLFREFLVESHDNLQTLDDDLLALERGDLAPDAITRIFRTIHTMKGTCGFLGLTNLERITHRGETLLALLRDGEKKPTPEVTNALLSLVDTIRAMLDELEKGRRSTSLGTELMAELERLSVHAGPGVPKAALQGELSVGSDAAVGVDAATTPPRAASAAKPGPNSSTRSVRGDSTSKGPSKTNRRDVRDVREVHKVDSSRPTMLGGGAEAPAEAERREGGHIADRFVRVDTMVLDQLMDRVSELVAARNQILQLTSVYDDPVLIATSQSLNLITSELQAGVMKTRMQPISSVWGRYPRIIRDLAVQCGKQIRLEMEGAETELDRTVLEAIKDPMVHVLRNAADHGIEAPADRVAAGKHPEGCLSLRAFHEGGCVNVEVSDDGRGVDRDRVLQRALDRGLVTTEQAMSMSDNDVVGLIFTPGFSTAVNVTNVSGRGVGMDVVRTNVERIGGTLDVSSVPGQGTKLRIKIPLTLAIIAALIVRVGNERFAIPQINLIELVRLDAEQVRTSVEKLFGATILRLRGSLLPLVDVRESLQVAPGEVACADDGVSVVIVQVEGRQLGLIVDDISDTQEIVVKPLNSQLGALGMYGGATILGDGNVALILDVAGLARRTVAAEEARQREGAAAGQRTASSQQSRTDESILLFGLPGGVQMAMPLSLVARLEEFPAARIERISDYQVVQYRGEVMPVLDVSSALQRGRGQWAEPSSMRENVPVIVYCESGRTVGLMVDSIVDVVDEPLEISDRVARSGVLGTAVIQSRVTEVVDVRALIRQVDPNLAAAYA